MRKEYLIGVRLRKLRLVNKKIIDILCRIREIRYLWERLLGMVWIYF